MAVEKKNGKWYYKGKYKLKNGKYKDYNRLAKGARLKKEAERMEEIFLLQQKDMIIALTTISFKELTNLYLNYAVTVIKSSSIQTDTNVINKLIDTFGDDKINLINRNVLQSYIDKQFNKYTLRYTEKIFYTLNKLFKFAFENGYISSNPMQFVRIPYVAEKVENDRLFWNKKQFDYFINNMNDRIIYYAIFNFLYYMGCRRGEALALSWADIDFKTKKVRFNKTITYNLNDSDYLITTPKTKNSNRIIQMPDELVEIMKELKNNQIKLCGTPLPFVFGTDKPLTPETLRRHFKNCIKEVNETIKEDKDKLPVLRIHDLRHSHASYLISNKLYDYDIAKRLGDTVATLHNTYAHWFDNAEDDIMAVLNKK